MTDALSLDPETVAAQCAEAKPVRDPWLVRRGFAWGASEVPALLLAYDPRPDEERAALGHHRESAEHASRRKISRGYPRIVERKAFAKDLAASLSMSAGQVREPLLFDAWVSQCGPELFAFRRASDVPPEWMPLVDRECPHLAATPDAWCRSTLDNGLVMAELKCSFAEDEPAMRWYHDAQIQAQIAVCSASSGVLVLGPGWADPKRELLAPPRYREVTRDEEAIARIRRVCARAWQDVVTIRSRIDMRET